MEGCNPLLTSWPASCRCWMQWTGSSYMLMVLLVHHKPSLARWLAAITHSLTLCLLLPMLWRWLLAL